MTDYQTIQTQKEEDGLLIITLSRPDVMNAFNARMMHEMVDALIMPTPMTRCAPLS